MEDAVWSHGASISSVARMDMRKALGLASMGRNSAAGRGLDRSGARFIAPCVFDRQKPAYLISGGRLGSEREQKSISLD